MLVVKLNYRIELHKLKTGNDVKLELSYYIQTILTLRHFPFWNLKTGNEETQIIINKNYPKREMKKRRL